MAVEQLEPNWTDLVPPTSDPVSDDGDESEGITTAAATVAIGVCAAIVTIPFLMSVFLGIKQLIRGNISDMRLKVLRRKIERFPKDDGNRQEQEGQFQESCV